MVGGEAKEKVDQQQNNGLFVSLAWSLCRFVAFACLFCDLLSFVEERIPAQQKKKKKKKRKAEKTKEKKSACACLLVLGLM